MKQIIRLLIFLLGFHSAFGQDSIEKVMETRAREMYRVIGLNSPDEWKKFIRENYTQTLIDKPMQAKVQGGPPPSSEASTKPKEPGEKIEAKARMFQMLHNDFGGGSIKSISTKGEKLEMRVISSGMSGTFMLTFSKVKPYLIDGLGIEAGNDNQRR